MEYQSRKTIDRRRLLRAGAVAIASGLAGCLGDRTGGATGDDGKNESDGGSGADTESDAEDGFAARLAASEPYRGFQYDAANSGRADVSGPTSDVEPRWTFREHEPDASYNVTTPAVVDGVVYVAEGWIDDNDDAKTVVYALDGATGEVRWDWAYEGTNGPGPIAVANDRVVLVIGSELVALDAESGAELVRTGRDFSDRATVDGDAAYVMKTTYADPPTLHAIDLASGDVRWRYALDEEDQWPTCPAVADGTVFQGGANVTALSATDGTVRWSAPVDGTVTGAPTVVDDTVYVPSGNGAVVAFDRTDGRRRWTGEVDAAGSSTGTLDAMVRSVAVADGSVFASNSWTLTALDADSGEKRWSKETGANDPPAVADGVVYVTGINQLLAYDATGGDLLLSYETEAHRGTGTGPVVLDDVVFFASDGLYALMER